MIHELKIWPGFFEAVSSGDKTFEVRNNDRDFRQGDALVLREYAPRQEGPWGEEIPTIAGGEYTGRIISMRVNYVLKHDDQVPNGLTPGYVVMAITPA